MMQHKGYIGKVEIDSDANLPHGSILGIRDVITFEGRMPLEAERAFRESVEDYLLFCKERGEEPDKPFSGKFVVRIAPKVHRLITAMAESSGMSLNAWINDRLVRDVLTDAASEGDGPKRRDGNRSTNSTGAKSRQKRPRKAS
jgi:predicted HicB family RNase H-like nuclease